jgi:citrate lyase subunit beta/citryl-CoA lyase
MSTIRPRRSVLYMPGSNARALDKAKTLPCDAVILDLEDAVAPDAKDVARRQAREAIAGGGFGRREVVLRINALSTPWGEEDLAAVIAAHPDAVLVPKVDDPDDVTAIGRRLDDHGVSDTVGIWAMMETPRAILNAATIAATRAAPHGRRLSAFVMGTNDLAKETRARLVPGRTPMLAMLTAAMLAARTQGLDVIDGVYNALKDTEGFRAECLEGRDLGMDGKTLIHPDQIAIANEVFAPAPDEIAWARTVIAAFAAPEAAGKGALRIEGKMVERLHADMAARTVALADAIAGAAA